MKEILPYIGLIPICWAIYSAISFYFKINNRREKYILITLKEKGIITKNQQFLLKNISFFETQNLQILLEEKIKFFQPNWMRLLYLTVALFFGIFFFGMNISNIIDSFGIRDVFVILFVIIGPCLYLYKKSKRSIILDLNEMTIDRDSYTVENKNISNLVKLKNATLTVGENGLHFKDNKSENEIEVQLKLSLAEQKIWQQIIQEITTPNNVYSS